MTKFDFLIFSIVAILMPSLLCAQEIVVPEGYELADSIVYRHVAGVDTLLAGKDVFHVMPLKAKGD